MEFWLIITIMINSQIVCEEILVGLVNYGMDAVLSQKSNLLGTRDSRELFN